MTNPMYMDLHREMWPTWFKDDFALIAQIYKKHMGHDVPTHMLKLLTTRTCEDPWNGTAWQARIDQVVDGMEARAVELLRPGNPANPITVDADDSVEPMLQKPRRHFLPPPFEASKNIEDVLSQTRWHPNPSEYHQKYWPHLLGLYLPDPAPGEEVKPGTLKLRAAIPTFVSADQQSWDVDAITAYMRQEAPKRKGRKQPAVKKASPYARSKGENDNNPSSSSSADPSSSRAGRARGSVARYKYD